MTTVLIYSKDYCPFCQRAKALFDKLGQNYEEIDLMANPQRKSEMVSMANGRTTVPQIFVNGKHLGGCDDVYALHDQGKLEPLLKD
ncbi:MAG: glutaredoxin 3 [Magnetococcales bacterium]|nr:glutaredoxin 3 [Magnetococcales bacterium]|tara:strand:+ start:27767 stop:28024 length:258 start_codon:yes stop_codon:yes gene_type:complete